MRTKSLNASALAEQLEKANARLTTLEARDRAFRAHLRATAGKQPDDILERLASALQLASVAELAHSSAALDSGPPARAKRDNERPMPGSSTHPARRRSNEMRKDISEILGRFEWAAENGWQRKPHPKADIPKLRCRVAQCPARDVTVDAWRTLRGGRTITHERCSSCGTPYSRDDLEEAV